MIRLEDMFPSNSFPLRQAPILFFLLAFHCLPAIASAAMPYSINFDIEDGLPSLEVYDLEILDEETVWFATDRGICIYDGYNFETITQKDGLLHDCVLRLNKDPWGRIWITGLDKRLCFYDGQRIQAYAWNDVIHHQIKPDTWIEDLAWDEEGNLVFMYPEKHVLKAYRIQQKSGQIKEFSPSLDPAHPAYANAYGRGFVDVQGQLIPNFPASTCSGIHAAHQWIYYVHKHSPNQLARMSLEDPTVDEVRDFAFRIFTVTYGNDGALYLGTEDGLYCFWDGDMSSVPGHSFPGIAISRSYEDKTGGFWLTTMEKGIFYVPSMGFRSIPAWEKVLANETVATVKKGTSELFIATQEGNVYALDTTGKMQHLLAIKKFPASVEAVTVGATTVFMGPYRLDKEKGGFRVRKQIVEGLVAASLELRDGTIFIAGYNGWEIRNAAEDSVLWQWSNRKMGRVRALLEMPDKILVGANNGLFAVDKDSKSVEMVKVGGAPFNYRVSDIELDQWGNCWISTLGNGLFCLRGSALHPIGEPEGLRSTIVNRIAFDSQGRLWIATNYGLARLEYQFAKGKFEIQEIKALTSLNGLPSNYVRDVGCWQGKIYIASDQGLHFFDPFLPDRNLPVPQVHLQQVLANDIPLGLEGPIQLEGHVDHLEIHFSAYSTLKSKQQPLYRCRLSGAGRGGTWEYTNARSMRYRDLGSGNYRFEVQACNARGEWAGQPIALSVEVKRAWLKNLAIPGLLLVAAILASAWAWRRRKRKAELESTDSPIPTPESPPEGLRFNLEQRQLVLPAGQGYKVVKLGQIHYLEANGSYVVLHLEGGKQHVISQSLTALEEMLPEEFFFRIHKSFLLNCEVVEGYESGRGGNIFLRDGSQVPIAVRRKAAFIQKMKKRGIGNVSVHKK